MKKDPDDDSEEPTENLNEDKDGWKVQSWLLNGRGLIFNDNEKVKLSHIWYLAWKKSKGGYKDLSLQTIQTVKIKVMLLFEKKQIKANFKE